MFPVAPTIDVSRGEGQVTLPHAEALAAADCAPARCEATPSGIIVRGVPTAYNALTVRTRLSPHVFVLHGDALETASTETVPVLRCPLAIVSGEPPRDVDDVSVLARLDKSCGKDLDQIRWTASGETAEVLRTETLEDGVYVLLWIGRTSADRLDLVASRIEDGSVLAVTSKRTWSIPPLHTSLTLAGFGEIEFIPKNREALLSVSKSLRAGTIVPGSRGSTTKAMKVS